MGVDFGQECDIVFNCDKFQCGMVGKPICKLAQMILDNKILTWSDNFIYLGIDFALGLSYNVCYKNIRTFMASVSSVLHFKSEGYENVFAEILIKKCLPVLIYRLDVVSLDSNSITLFTQVWNCAFRWLVGWVSLLPLDIYLIVIAQCLRFLLYCNVLSLYACMQSTDNVLLTKLFLYRYYDKKIQDLYASYDLTKFYNAFYIKRCVKTKFNEYCDN